MFFHNIGYTIKVLFKNKVLIFWTFAFPILLAIFFNMAFSGLEDDEVLKVFDIAVVDNDKYQSSTIYKEVFKELSDKDNKDRLFKIKYVNLKKANKLLDDKKIEGYIYFKDVKPEIIVKESGINQTIMKFVVEEVEQKNMILSDLVAKEMTSTNNFNPSEVANSIINKLDNNDIKLENVSNSNLSYTLIEFYTLIAMACMYGGTLGMVAVNNSLANMSKKGRRISISPTKKSVVVLSSTIGSYIVSLVGISLLMLFLLFVIKVDFGDSLYPALLLTAVANLAGTAFGVLIATLFKVSEGAKTAIIISVTMLLSVLSGMMGVTVKYLLDKYVPIVNMLNPTSMITDGYYSLYYYNSLDRYWNNIVSLLIFIALCVVVSSICLRREKYDSI